MLVVMHWDSYLGDLLCDRFLFYNSNDFDAVAKTDSYSRTVAGPSFQVFDVNCPALDTTSDNAMSSLSGLMMNLRNLGADCTSQSPGYTRFRMYVPLDLVSQSIKITAGSSATLSYAPSAICFFDKNLGSSQSGYTFTHWVKMSDYSLLTAPSPPVFTFNSGTKTISGNPSTAGKYFMIYGLTITNGGTTGTAINTIIVNV